MFYTWQYTSLTNKVIKLLQLPNIINIVNKTLIGIEYNAKNYKHLVFNYCKLL